MPPHRDVVVLVAVREERGRGIDRHEIDAAEAPGLRLDLLHPRVDAEDVGDHADRVESAELEAHLLCRSDHAHPLVVRVLAAGRQHPTDSQVPAGERPTGRDVQLEGGLDRRLPCAGRGDQTEDPVRRDHAVPELLERDVLRDEAAAGDRAYAATLAEYLPQKLRRISAGPTW